MSLARDFRDLKERLGRMRVGFTYEASRSTPRTSWR